MDKPIDKNQKVMVTGGAGFIGSHLVDALIKAGYQVTVIDDLSSGKKKYINKKAAFFQKDIGDYKAVKSHFAGIDYVFHVAARARMQPSIFDPRESFTNNVIGTFNVLLASKEAGVKRLIYSASSSAYGEPKTLPLKENMPPHPRNPYALFKYMGEGMARLFYELYGLPMVCLRYFNVYGERQPMEGEYATVIGKFLRQRQSGQPLTIIGNGKQKRDFTYVGDVVRANILAMESDQAVGQLINVGTGQNYSINQVANWVSGSKIFLPFRIAEVEEVLADNSKALKLLGWRPLTKLEDWLKNQ